MFRNHRLPAVHHVVSADRTVEQRVQRARELANPSGLRIGI